jgi:hypothetical protein
MDRPLYHPVQDLLERPEYKKLIVDERDRQLLAVITKVCQELAYHPQSVVEEPPLEFDFDYDKTKALWFLYPPAVLGILFTQQARIFELGRGLISADDIIAVMERPEDPTSHEQTRTALTVYVQSHSSPSVREFQQTLIVATKVVYHPVGMGTLGPDGVMARRQMNGTLFSNTNSPRLSSASKKARQQQQASANATSSTETDAYINEFGPPTKRTKYDAFGM